MALINKQMHKTIITQLRNSNSQLVNFIGLFEIMSDLWSNIHALLVTGALTKGGTWGGPECRAQLSMDVHFYESTFWVISSFIVFFAANMGSTIRSLSKQIKEALKVSPITSLSRTFEVIVGLLHLAMFAQLVYFKYSISSLVNLMQPCHVMRIICCKNRLPASWICTMMY